MQALQETTLAYLRRDAEAIPFWRMVVAPLDGLRSRAEAILASTGASDQVSVADSEALPGAGSAPGATMPSIAIALVGDHLQALRRRDIPIVARVRDRRTFIDLRTVEPSDDSEIVDALRTCLQR